MNTLQKIDEIIEKISIDSLASKLVVQARTVTIWQKKKEVPGSVAVAIDYLHRELIVNDSIFHLWENANEREKKDLREIFKLPEKCTKFEFSKEFRSAAGNSFVNIFRGAHDLPYKQILIDVADKITEGRKYTPFKLNDDYTEEDIEKYIDTLVRKRITKEIALITEDKSEEELKKDVEELKEELKKKGVADTTIKAVSGIILGGGAGLAAAPAVATAVFYSGFYSGIMATVFGIAGPALVAAGAGVGIVAALPMFAFAFSGPAYRKTIPATFQLINIRNRLKEERPTMENVINIASIDANPD